MTIQAIFFDADGVVQRQRAEFRSILSDLLGSPQDNIDAFLQDIFKAERPALTGHRNFVEDLADVLLKWNCRGTVQDALRAWEQIDVDDDMLTMINTLRVSGTYCGLATNQQQYRARYMSETLGYREVFDREFYSCVLGYMKPNTGYFQAILQKLPFPPGNVLFIDDHEPNIMAARQVGLHASVFQPAPDANRHAVLQDLLAQYELHGYRCGG